MKVVVCVGGWVCVCVCVWVGVGRGACVRAITTIAQIWSDFLVTAEKRAKRSCHCGCWSQL